MLSLATFENLWLPPYEEAWVSLLNRLGALAQFPQAKNLPTTTHVSEAILDKSANLPAYQRIMRKHSTGHPREPRLDQPNS